MSVSGVTAVEIDFGAMTTEQRQDLQAQLRGAAAPGTAAPSR